VQGFHGPSGKDRDGAAPSCLSEWAVVIANMTAPALSGLILQDFRCTPEADIGSHRSICRNPQEEDHDDEPKPNLHSHSQQRR
jgi:hypothetical protein